MILDLIKLTINIKHHNSTLSIWYPHKSVLSHSLPLSVLKCSKPSYKNAFSPTSKVPLAVATRFFTCLFLATRFIHPKSKYHLSLEAFNCGHLLKKKLSTSKIKWHKVKIPVPKEKDSQSRIKTQENKDQILQFCQASATCDRVIWAWKCLSSPMPPDIPVEKHPLPLCLLSSIPVPTDQCTMVLTSSTSWDVYFKLGLIFIALYTGLSGPPC